MTLPLNKRRLFLGAGAIALLSLALVLLGRMWLAGWVLGALLHLGGASQIKLTVTEATPWRVVVDGLGFQVRSQVFAAQRVTIARRHWWTPSLGAVHIEQARVPLTIDGSDTNPWAWSTYQNGRAKVQPWQVPLEELVVEGRLVVQAAALPAREVPGKITARLERGQTWQFSVEAKGPGLSLQGEGRYDVARDVLAFQVTAAALDLQTWGGFARRLVFLPGGPWELAGKFTGSAAGRLAGKKLTTSGTVRWHEGQVTKMTGLSVHASGIEGELEFSDLAQLITQPGRLRLREVRAGQLILRNVEATLALAGAHKVAVSRASFQALGGTLTIEPFTYFPGLREVEAVVQVDGIDLGEIMALTPDLPVQVSGRMSGHLPVRIDESGLRFGTGWLELTPGLPARLALTTGATRELRLTELRLDIRPPNAPPGCSARLHLAGTPVDSIGGAPVRLDLNVSGPLERFLHFDSPKRIRD